MYEAKLDFPVVRDSKSNGPMTAQKKQTNKQTIKQTIKQNNYFVLFLIYDSVIIHLLSVCLFFQLAVIGPFDLESHTVIHAQSYCNRPNYYIYCNFFPFLHYMCKSPKEGQLDCPKYWGTANSLFVSSLLFFVITVDYSVIT